LHKLRCNLPHFDQSVRLQTDVSHVTFRLNLREYIDQPE